LEECGEQCVTMVGIPTMPEWYADSWDMKWMCQGRVSPSFVQITRYCIHSHMNMSNWVTLRSLKSVLKYW